MPINLTVLEYDKNEYISRKDGLQKSAPRVLCRFNYPDGTRNVARLNVAKGVDLSKEEGKEITVRVKFVTYADSMDPKVTIVGVGSSK